MHPYNIAFLLIYQEKYNIPPHTSRTHAARRTHSGIGPQNDTPQKREKCPVKAIKTFRGIPLRLWRKNVSESL